MADLAAWHEVHPNQIGRWKKRLLDASPEVFAGKTGAADKSRDDEVWRLYEKVGQLTVERDFLVKVSGKL